MRYRLRTLLIVVALGPPVLAVISLGLLSAQTRPMTANFLTFAACVSAVIAWCWTRRPVTPWGRPMLRYKLRTLLILLAVLPPLLWIGWTKYAAWKAERERQELVRAAAEWVRLHQTPVPWFIPADQ